MTTMFGGGSCADEISHRGAEAQRKTRLAKIRYQLARLNIILPLSPCPLVSKSFHQPLVTSTSRYFPFAAFFAARFSEAAFCSSPFHRSSIHRGGSFFAFHSSHSFCSAAAFAGSFAARSFFSPGSAARLNS